MGDVIKKKEKRNWFYSYNFIFDQPISAHAKLVYIFLCRCADSEGQAFPSYSTIAKKCSISRRTAINAINELKEAGLLHCEQRKKEDGSLTSNQYLIFDEPQINVPPPPSPPNENTLVHQVHHPSAPDALPLVHQVHHPSAPDAQEVLPNEVLPIINNNNRDVVVEKNGKSEIIEHIESIIGHKIKGNVLNTLPKESLEQALKAYQTISAYYPIHNPAGFFVYLAKNGIDAPKPAAGRRQSFQFEQQHNWTEEELESLWERIGEQ